MHVGRVQISLFRLSHCLLFPLTMYISLSTRYNVISKIIRTKQTFSTFKNMLLVEVFGKDGSIVCIRSTFQDFIG